MEPYGKIPALYKRDSDSPKQVIPVVKDMYIAQLDHAYALWQLSEKIDGTNVRIIWDGYEVRFAGRKSDQLQPNVQSAIEEQHPHLEAMFEQVFDGQEVTVYGEGFGPGVNKGGKYGDRIRFRGFDVVIGGSELNPADAYDVIRQLGLSPVKVYPMAEPYPSRLFRMMQDIVAGSSQYHYMHSAYLHSEFGDFYPEGYVMRPRVNLYKKNGSAIKVKLTFRDAEDYTGD